LKARAISAFYMYEMTDTSGSQQNLQSLIAVLPVDTGGCVLPAATCVETTPDMSSMAGAAAELESPPETAKSLMDASGGRVLR
jgi:hypothetical protein